MYTFADQLDACLDRVLAHCTGLPAPFPTFVLFFSVSDGRRRAHVVHARGNTLDEAWREGAAQAVAWAAQHAPGRAWLRVDWADAVDTLTWQRFNDGLAQVKRNYFRCGLALDEGFVTAFLEQELNANAMLYGGSTVPHAVVNAHNFAVYSQTRYQVAQRTDFAPDRKVYLFTTGAVFCGEDGVAHDIVGRGLDAGRRVVPQLDQHAVHAVVDSSARFLARQVQPQGRFVYGTFPCFDRPIPTYNTLRHASATYAMVEAWELTGGDALRQSIETSLAYLAGTLIRRYRLPDGRQAAFLVDTGDEIKLGGNATCLLAFAKYSEVTGSREWLALLELLAVGIAWMQDPQSGRLSHVLHARDLTVKDEFRIIYYDGEAAFGLMRLYGLTGDARWLAVVEKAFEHFIAQEHWQAHDHWLGYCVNELTLHRPLEKYFRFGIQNVAGHLDFVLGRKTTFPTLLELMLAAQKMVARLEGMDDMRHLLDALDLDKFHRALHARAHYLLNGYFWPEMAMYFRAPASIVGSFFIRHHSFRVRIDDVEHYLSGFVAYHRLLAAADVGAAPRPARAVAEGAAPVHFWTAERVQLATGGQWVVPPAAGWRAEGVAPAQNHFRKGRMVLARRERGTAALSPLALGGALQQAAAVICTDPADHLERGVPVLRVEDPGQAVLQLGRHARAAYRGEVLAVAGPAGRTCVGGMLVDTLRAWGPVGLPESAAGRPQGLAWNMSCMPQSAPWWVLEVPTSRPAAQARLARPTVVLVASGHPPGGEAAEALVQRQAAIFRSMAPGGHAVLPRDMDAFDAVADAARRAGQRVLSFGAHPGADLRLIGFRNGAVRAEVLGVELRFRVNAPGDHVALDALAALAAVAALRLPLLPAVERIARHMPEAGRGLAHTVHLGSDGGSLRLIDESGSANPASMRAALELLGQSPCRPEQRVAILGDMQRPGALAQQSHLALEADLLAARADRVMLCGPLMRALHRRIDGRVKASWFPDVHELFAALGSTLRANDWVLVKSSAATGLSRMVKVLKALP